jgi:RNA-directed DNA polymerase
MATKLARIAEKARLDPNCKFTSLFHLVGRDLLRECFAGLKENAAAGIDGVMKAKYEEHLEDNLTDLVERLHRMAYLPQPVRRVYIPKPGSDKKRPLGMPVFEDKLVQSALVRILGAIYEQDFISDSYGFRPGRSCHDALRALSVEVEGGLVNYIVEADIKGFFDNVHQTWLMTFLAHRIADKRVQCYINRFLKAGILEDGSFHASERGTPQGGVISPLLANIYLHYALDLWFVRKFRQTCIGGARHIRYADDYVGCFQYKDDAARFRQAMEERLALFSLSLAEEKTKVVEFGPLAAQQAKARGEKADTFDFLGFTHYCSRSRNGKRFRMKRTTIRKRFTAKVAIFKEWMKKNRKRPVPEIIEKVSAKLRGHYAYYGVTDNSAAIGRFACEVQKLIFKWLNRRGKRGCLSWRSFSRLLDRYPLPTPRIRVSMFTST